MSGGLSLEILGCGSSGGVPRLGNHWGACDPSNPKNRRRRCSALVERQGENGVTRVLIDTSPDMRAQLLDADVGTLDAVLYTHDHADHLHGIDDLRMIVMNTKARLPVYADERTRASLMTRFRYAFETPPGSEYPPILDMHDLHDQVTISGAGGAITFETIPVVHGAIIANGFRIDGLVYMPDVSDIPKESLAKLQDMDTWIIDCLRETPHSTHFHLERSLEWIARLRPHAAILTNLHVDLDYLALTSKIDPHISVAYDGLRIPISTSTSHQ